MKNKSFHRFFLAFVLVLVAYEYATPQTPFLERTITISFQQERLDVVLRKISVQGGFTFSYSPSILEAGKIITVDFTNKTVREILDQLSMPTYAKTTGSKGIHVYIPIVRGPVQKDVWSFAKAIAIELETRHPEIITAEYRKVKRPHGRVLVDYNQNAWGRTLASIYSIRPTPVASVSTPVTWEEVEEGVRIEDFRIDNVVDRVREIGDLWKPVAVGKKRFDLRKIFEKKKERP